MMILEKESGLVNKKITKRKNGLEFGLFFFE